MAALIGKEYQAEAAALLVDPIVINMAKGLGSIDLAEIAWEDGTPRHTFMLAARNEYHARGGVDNITIGGVANAIIALLGR